MSQTPNCSEAGNVTRFFGGSQMTGELTSMKAGLWAPGAFGKVLATLTIAAGMMMYGCSNDTARSDAAKAQFKNVTENESKLLKAKGKGTRKGVGGPKSIKGKLADIEKDKTEG